MVHRGPAELAAFLQRRSWAELQPGALQAMIYAVCCGDVAALRLLRQAGLSATEARAKSNMVLWTATRNNDHETVAELHACGLDTRDVAAEKWTVLRYAASQGFVETFRALCAFGVTLEMLREGDDSLARAAGRHGRAAILQELATRGVRLDRRVAADLARYGTGDTRAWMWTAGYAESLWPYSPWRERLMRRNILAAALGERRKATAAIPSEIWARVAAYVAVEVACR